MSSDIGAIDLEQLEMMAYSGRYEQTAALLLRFLDAISVRGMEFSPSEHLTSEGEQDREKLQTNTRLAGAVTTMLAAKKFLPPKKGYILLMSYKRVLRAIFMASGFGNMDHLHWHMLKQDANGQSVVENEGSLLKLMLTVTPGSPQSDQLYRQWVRSLPLDISLPFWLSFVDSDIVLDEKSDVMRQSVASMYEEFKIPENFDLPRNLLLRVVNAWMLSSYMGYRDKHKPKLFMNKILKQFAEQNGVKQPSVAAHNPDKNLKSKNKPRLVVMLERFTSTHAMHRCYRTHIDSLRKYFYTIGVGVEDRVDEGSVAAFDEMYTFANDEAFRNIAANVIKLKPDLVFYPSIGMETWAVVLAQFRFAPIQFMTLGHPATSMSDAIDYAFSNHTAPDLFGEKIVYSEELERTQPVAHPAGQDFTRLRQSTQVVRVAINAKLYKINYRLIDACKAIQEQSSMPVEFVFFPACHGVTYDAFKKELGRHLKAVVFPSTDYPTFIDRLRACDLVLNPFPFGNTNGIHDCARIGLPFVCLDGEEPHSHYDVLLSEQLGYPDFLRAKTIEDYVAAAVRLIDDESLREGLIQEMVDAAPMDAIEAAEEGVGFGVDVYKLYLNHAQLKASDERLIDLSSFDLPEK